MVDLQIDPVMKAIYIMALKDGHLGYIINMIDSDIESIECALGLSSILLGWV